MSISALQNASTLNVSCNTVQTLVQPIDRIGINNINGQIVSNVYNATPYDLLSNTIILGTQSANATVNLPTTASLKTYLQSLGYVIIYQSSFIFTVTNQNATYSLTLSTNSDSTWAFATSQGTSTTQYVIPVNTSKTFRIFYNGGTPLIYIGDL